MNKGKQVPNESKVVLKMSITSGVEGNEYVLQADIDSESAASVDMSLLINHMSRSIERKIKRLFGIPISLEEYHEYLKQQGITKQGEPNEREQASNGSGPEEAD